MSVDLESYLKSGMKNILRGAEPCPFSPYSDVNIRDTSLRDALNSALFRKLNESELLNRDHTGGCILFEQDSEVKELLSV